MEHGYTLENINQKSGRERRKCDALLVATLKPLPGTASRHLSYCRRIHTWRTTEMPSRHPTCTILDMSLVGSIRHRNRRPGSHPYLHTGRRISHICTNILCCKNTTSLERICRPLRNACASFHDPSSCSSDVIVVSFASTVRERRSAQNLLVGVIRLDVPCLHLQLQGNSL